MIIIRGKKKPIFTGEDSETVDLLWHLLANLNFRVFFLFLIGILDEVADSIAYWSAFLVSVSNTYNLYKIYNILKFYIQFFLRNYPTFFYCATY